eukprot:s3731_g2.t1
MAFIEKGKVEERERFPDRYCLQNTLEHVLLDFRVLPAKQAQRIRCGGTAIYISTQMVCGQWQLGFDCFGFWAMFLEVPYCKPRQKGWDLLTAILAMLDLHMPTYRSKVLKLVIGVDSVEEGHWVENLSKLWGPLPRASLKEPAGEQHGGEPGEPSHQHGGEPSQGRKTQGMKRPAAR